MHVLHFITGLDTRDGGPSVAIEGLATAQRKLGVRVSLIATYRSDDSPARSERLSDFGVEVKLLGPTRGPLQRVAGMRQTCQTALTGHDRPDIVHVHNTWEDLQHHASRAAFAAGIPYIFRPCGMLDPWSLSQSRWKKKAMLALRVGTNLNRAAAIHYTTQTEHDMASRLKLTAPTIVEPNGVSVEREIRFTGDDLRHRHDLGPGPLLLFLGRLHPQKGLYILIEAFAKVLARWAADRPRPTLLLAGPDEAGTQTKLIQQLRERDIEDTVVFTGSLTGDDKLMALQGSDLFCLPSYLESFGIAVVEALSGGTPALISDQVNIHREVVAAGVGASTPVDANAYATELETWLLNDSQRLAAADKAASWAQSTYNWDIIAAAWIHRHYPQLAGSTKR